MTFGGVELYPTLAEKAVAIAFSLITNHGFVDGNKRVGFAVLDVLLRVNDFRIQSAVDEAEATTLAVASHTMTRDQFLEWVRAHIEPLPPPTP